MARAAVLSFLLVALLGAGTAAATPTEAELRAVALSTADLGEGMAVMQSGPIDELRGSPVATYAALFVRAPTERRPSVEVVLDLLIDGSFDASFGTADLAAGYMREMAKSGFSFALAEPPEIGTGTIMHRMTGRLLDRPVAGECIAWRHEPVIAAVCAIGDERPTALGYALTQQARLEAAFGR
jgi:hypothetical protein